jgi:hypothetical protein
MIDFAARFAYPRHQQGRRPFGGPFNFQFEV